MPNYDYICRCGNKEEHFVSITKVDAFEVKCPICSCLMQREFSTQGALTSYLAGDGWTGKITREGNYRKRRSVKMDHKMRKEWKAPKLAEQ